MSENHPPPPPSTDAIQAWLTQAEALINLIVENFRRGTWVKRLLLLNAIILFACNRGFITQALKIFSKLGLTHFPLNPRILGDFEGSAPPEFGAGGLFSVLSPQSF